MKAILSIVPEATGEEAFALQRITEGFTEEQLVDFGLIYREKRKDAQTMLITTLLGFIGLAGIQRFLIGQVGMGLLYLFTLGFCYIGTIIDLVNHQKLAIDYNLKQAREAALRVS